MYHECYYCPSPFFRPITILCISLLNYLIRLRINIPTDVKVVQSLEQNYYNIQSQMFWELYFFSIICSILNYLLNSNSNSTCLRRNSSGSYLFLHNVFCTTHYSRLVGSSTLQSNKANSILGYAISFAKSILIIRNFVLSVGVWECLLIPRSSCII